MNLHPEMIKLIHKLSEDAQIELVKEHPYIIKYVKSYNVMLAVASHHMMTGVKSYGYSTIHIKNKLKKLSKDKRADIMLTAINTYPYSIQFIVDHLKDLSEQKRFEIMLASVSKAALTIELFVDQLTDMHEDRVFDIMLTAIKKEPIVYSSLLGHIKHLNKKHQEILKQEFVAENRKRIKRG